MKDMTSKAINPTAAAKLRLRLLLAASVATLAGLSARADDPFRGNGRDEEHTHYRQIDLVSDISAVGQLKVPDDHLVNPWGIAFGATGPF